LTLHLITNIHLPQANTQEHSWINISSTYKISEKNTNVYEASDHPYAVATQFNHDPTKKTLNPAHNGHTNSRTQPSRALKQLALHAISLNFLP
jgi:hypothetical protein